MNAMQPRCSQTKSETANHVELVVSVAKILTAVMLARHSNTFMMPRLVHVHCATPTVICVQGLAQIAPVAEKANSWTETNAQSVRPTASCAKIWESAINVPKSTTSKEVFVLRTLQCCSS